MDPASDVWSFDDENRHSSSSSGSFPQIPLSGYWSSFSSIDDIYTADFPPVEGEDRVKLSDSELIPSSAQSQGQLHEINMLMDSTDLTGQALDDNFQLPQAGSSHQLNLLHQIPVQMLYNQSLFPNNKSCSFDSSTSIYKVSDQPMLQQSSATSMNQHSDTQFSEAAIEELALTRSMVSVISSFSSSSSSTAAPLYLHQRQSAKNYQCQANYYPPKNSSFYPYKSSICPKVETQKNVHSQNMIKKTHRMLRRVNLLKAGPNKEETQLTAYQMQHMVLERRRRERLNANFHSLWELLPPGSKKDKTSVLCSTTTFMKTLKDEIFELEKKNRVLEEHVLSVEVKEESIVPKEKVLVTVCKSSQPNSEMHQIDLVIMVRVQCNLVRVVLHVLECIKTMKAISLLSMDAFPNTQQWKLLATLKLAIQGSTWDEGTFKEAITVATHLGLSTTALKASSSSAQSDFLCSSSY